MMRLRRNKVVLTILIGLAVIGLFAVTQSGVAILAIARFGASFSQISDTNLPALIAASQLSELSQTLVATAPEIALADTQIRRQTIADQLNERVTALARTVERLDPAAVDREQVSYMQRQLNTLVINLRGLDELVRERIDANNALEAAMARLPSLATRVRNIASESMIGEQDRERSSGSTMFGQYGAHLVEWSAMGMECITLMLTTSAVPNTSRLERVKSQIKALIDAMERIRAQLPQSLQSKIESTQSTIVQFGLGVASLPDARRVQIENEAAIRTALRLIKQTSGAFVTSVSGISSTTQRHQSTLKILQRDGRIFHLAEHCHVAAVLGGRNCHLYVRATRGDHPPKGPSAIHACASRRATGRDLNRRSRRDHRNGEGDAVLRHEHCRSQEGCGYCARGRRTGAHRGRGSQQCEIDLSR
jgi:hypothetical protein